MIELLITIGIIGLMSAAAAANFHLGQKKAILDDAVNDVLVEIQKLQNIAISGIEIADPASVDFDPDEDTLIPCAYGLHYLSPTSFQIAAELPDAFGQVCAILPITYEIDGSLRQAKNIDYTYAGEGTKIDIEEFSFSTPLVEFGEPFDDIYFIPPDPEIYIGGVGLLIDSDTDGRFDSANTDPSGPDIVEEIVVCLAGETCNVGDPFRRVIEVSLGGRIELIR